VFSFWSNEVRTTLWAPPELGNRLSVQRVNASRVTPPRQGTPPAGSYRCDVAERSVDLWASFPHDPRDPAVASLRASDADREVVHGLLTEAFADGRLDRDEYDERTTATLQARTLGELPPLVTDLVPDRPLLPATVPLSAASSSEIQQRAQEKWHKERREAFGGFLFPTVICWVIWLAVGADGFLWPLIPMAVTFLNFLRVAANRTEIVESEVKRLERKRTREIEARNKKKQTGP
jgi:hypothetical protein